METKPFTVALTLCVALFAPQASIAQPFADRPNVVMQPVTSAKTGMVAMRIPLPADWKMVRQTQPSDPVIVGPNGIKVYSKSGGMFAYTENPQMLQAWQMSGQPMRAPIPVAQIVQEDIVPVVQREGGRFLRQYPLPQLAAKNAEYQGWLYKALPSRDQFDVLATEWAGKNGEQWLVILNQHANSADGTVYWGYQLEMLEAPPEQFQQASRALIHALLNKQHNPEHIRAYNAMEAQQTQQSQAQHSARMRQNQQNFDRRQQIHKDMVDSVNNSQMSIYRSQRDAGDRSQRRIINSINEEETVTNPHDNRQYQVEAGSSQTWMNGDNQVIQSNDGFYDPNRDPSVNRQGWRRVR